MAERQTYTVIVPFPTGRGHWSTAGEELDLLDVEANALLSAGRLALKSTSIPAEQATAQKAE
ncbi:hypothetical protein NYP20_06075 [Pseudomonas sp. N3-W]|jgi:hypothetical protein|uniref:Uncharacterized protein n=1 Tax=Pseudomonas fungipugnans TaxID=3024217 RepID=A0ABT6QTT0_9PSED|nr:MULTISPECIES: hypothetical protein [unclassified Pseudomonas]MDI2594141.1 hypothetical protein [Pseudomonas sp. 681]UWF50529.1 hypothetical protein NYP20_06075 [Pseudomonas sp. N3-W]